MKNFHVKYTGFDYKKDFSQIPELEFGMWFLWNWRENSKHNFQKKMHDKLLQMLVMEDEYIDISVILKQFGKTKNWF
jgi:hypothetical protein